MAERIVTSRAEADIAAGFDWYEACCSGLGTRFVVGVDAALAAVARNPRACSVRHAGHRMKTLGRFPYAIYLLYEPAADGVSVRRVLRFRRNIPKQL